MRKMIGGLALIVVGFALVAPLEAQQRRGGAGARMNLDAQMAQLTELLGLDEEQATKVREILEAQATSRRERFQGARGSMNREAMMEIVQNMQAETNTKLAEVLSEDQMALYEGWVAEQMQRRRPPFD
ncbi:hypothetical protein [Candidatus Palauibacter sp.]|uniref:hypothetical protein n=1 Tax=Candidatus Palauibacter sp. TaxID=3101350 RepID=UPI003AF2BC62